MESVAKFGPKDVGSSTWAAWPSWPSPKYGGAVSTEPADVGGDTGTIQVFVGSNLHKRNCGIASNSDQSEDVSRRKPFIICKK